MKLGLAPGTNGLSGALICRLSKIGMVNRSARALDRQSIEIAEMERQMPAVAESLRFSTKNTWPILLNGAVVGTIAVAEANGAAVGHCRSADIADDISCEVRSQLLEAAVRHGREAGCLKITVHAPSPYYWETDFLRSLGLHYAGSRPAQGMFLCEFYVDLYHQPESRRRMSDDSPSNECMSAVGA